MPHFKADLKPLMLRVFDLLPAMVFIKDAKTLRYKLVNREVERVFGQPCEAWVGKTVHEMFSADAAEIHDRNDRKTLAHGNVLTFPEIAVDTASGQRRWYHTRIIPVDAAAGGLLVGIAQDITPQREAQTLLAESESKYRSLVELSPYAILVHSEEVYVFANQAAVSTLHAKRASDIVGRSIWDTIPEALWETRRPVVRDVYAGKRTLYRFESQARCLDGQIIPIEVSGTATLYQGKPSVQVIIRDISDRVSQQRALEQAYERHNKSLRAWSARLLKSQEDERRRIAQELHDDFGQRLTVIGLQLATLERMLGNQTSPAIQDQIHQTQVLAEQMLEQIRTLSLNLRPPMLMDLGLLAALRWLLNQTQLCTELEIEFAVHPEHIDCPYQVGIEVYRIVQESLTNVIRHAQATRVTFTLRRDADTIELAVADDGVGFDIDQIGDTDSLGILGIRERVAALGGEFGIRSAPGEGTQIHIRIPQGDTPSAA